MEVEKIQKTTTRQAESEIRLSGTCLKHRASSRRLLGHFRKQPVRLRGVVVLDVGPRYAGNYFFN